MFITLITVAPESSACRRFISPPPPTCCCPPSLTNTPPPPALFRYDNKGFSQLVFYLEACESGSIFDGLLPSNINVYATTASNPTESSWGWYVHP